MQLVYATTRPWKAFMRWWIVGSIFSVSMSISACPPAGHASKILDVPPSGAGRVPNFYETVAQIDPKACKAILVSLNKQWLIDERKLDDYPRASVTVDSFLWSDLQVPWVRRLVQKSSDEPDFRGSGHDGEPRALNLARATIAGRSVTLFRRDVVADNESWDATLAFSRLWISEQPPPTFPSDRELTQDALQLIGGSEILLNLPDRLPRSSKQSNSVIATAASGTTVPLLLNALMAGGELYLLALDAGEAEVHAPRGGDGTVNVYALKFHSETDVRPTCLFRSR
jgi:hypothetical protein